MTRTGKFTVNVSFVFKTNNQTTVAIKVIPSFTNWNKLPLKYLDTSAISFCSFDNYSPVFKRSISDMGNDEKYRA